MSVDSLQQQQPGVHLAQLAASCATPVSVSSVGVTTCSWSGGAAGQLLQQQGVHVPADPGQLLLGVVAVPLPGEAAHQADVGGAGLGDSHLPLPLVPEDGDGDLGAGQHGH